MKRTLITAATLAAAGLAQAEAATYNIDPTHTFVVFEARHFNTSTLRGRFDRKEGSVSLDRIAKTGSADITIAIASVSTGVPAFDAQLKGKDFFNADDKPSARFV